MGKINSYYDWEMSFKKKPKHDEDGEPKNEEVSSTGIQEEILKEYLKTWRKKNLR